MDHISIVSQSQDPVHVQSKIDDFFGRFKIATLMHRCGMRKHHGHSIRFLTQAIFTLPFVGKNFFRGIVLNSQLPFGKDAAYDLLKGGTYNWRRLLLTLGLRLFGVFNRLTDDERESVLISVSIHWPISGAKPNPSRPVAPTWPKTSIHRLLPTRKADHTVLAVVIFTGWKTFEFRLP
jgi:hypothetical protein